MIFDEVAGNVVSFLHVLVSLVKGTHLQIKHRYDASYLESEVADTN